MIGRKKKGPKIIDLTGHIYGRWTVLRQATNDGLTVMWWCRCECGTERAVQGCALRCGTSTCCGCYHPPRPHVDRTINMIGKMFGYWTVIGPAPMRPRYKLARWLCRCVCGREKDMKGTSLRSGYSKSCGCKSHLHMMSRPYESLYGKLRHCAKERGIGLYITYEQFVLLTEIKNCFYCWTSIQWMMNARDEVRINKQGLSKRNSGYNLDRKSNLEGYTLDNVVICCARCNHSRANRYTHAEWYEMNTYFRNLAGSPPPCYATLPAWQPSLNSRPSQLPLIH